MNPKKASPKDDTETPSTSSGQAKKAGAKKGPKAETKKAAKEDTVPASKRETGISGIRIRLSAFDHRVLDEAAGKIIDTAERSGAVVHGPIPLPTRIRKFTVNRSTFVHKNARDQFEMRTHRRLIDLTETTFKTVESLQGLSLPSGVDIEIKMK
jgi:small subunit ribosomal protein S10